MFASLASFTVAATSSRTNRSNCSTLIGCGWTPSFASLYDAIISKTIEGRITSWNAGATRIFGYDASEMIGESILRIIPPDLHDEEKEILAKLQRGERIEHYETVRVAKDAVLVQEAREHRIDDHAPSGHWVGDDILDAASCFVIEAGHIG
jgi:PAS domain S-box-containing protein